MLYNALKIRILCTYRALQQTWFFFKVEGTESQYIISNFKFPKNYISTQFSSYMIQLHKITVHQIH
jgi:hypothetical protein